MCEKVGKSSLGIKDCPGKGERKWGLREEVGGGRKTWILDTLRSVRILRGGIILGGEWGNYIQE